MNIHASAPLPTDQIALNAKTPEWFDWAVCYPCESRWVDVAGVPIHYLSWQPATEAPEQAGLLLVHGGGAHANWWRFVAPFFTSNFQVAAIDLSGMGDSGRRTSYDAAVRAKEMLAVIDDAFGARQVFVVGHSFGGFMSIRFGVDYGQRIAGAIIADTPVRPPDDPPPGRATRIFNSVRTYPSYEEAVARFRLLPEQECNNDFIVEYIARHSVKPVDDGWIWKFDPKAMGASRWNEPFHEHLTKIRCKTAYIHGENSALIGKKQLAYISSLMPSGSPVVEIPQAAHHMMLDQPLAFIAAVRSIIECWRCV